MSNFSREQLLTDLHNSTIEVTFTKVNGDQRVMTCTLQEALLPARKVLKEGETPKIKKVNEAVIPVYDINAKGFRSFRVDSVTNVVAVAE